MASEIKKEKKEVKGLVRLRAATSDGGPSYHCENCRCARYSPCGCPKKIKR